MPVETVSENLYAPRNTQSWSNHLRYDRSWDLYADKSRLNEVIMTPPSSSDSAAQMYSREAMQELITINDAIMNLSVLHDDKYYNYQDLCYRYENNNCMLLDVLQLFSFDAQVLSRSWVSADEIVSQNTISAAQLSNRTYVTYPLSYSDYADNYLFLLTILGWPVSTHTLNVNYSSYTAAVSVVNATPALHCIYLVDETLYGEKLSTQWEDLFLSYLQEYETGTDYRFSYSKHDSVDTEFLRAVASDSVNFASSFMLLSVFSAIVLIRVKRKQEEPKHDADAAVFQLDGAPEEDEHEETCPLMRYKLDMKRSRSLMAVCGVIGASMAVASSFGIVGGMFGVKFNSVVSIAPFLLVGLGIDDMFVLLRSYELTEPTLSIEQRVKITMERGGVSILFTSVTDLVAFCVGSTSRFGAVSSFCVYCGVGVFMDFVFQVSFFLGFMVYDSRWQDTGKCCQREAAADTGILTAAKSASFSFESPVVTPVGTPQTTERDGDQAAPTINPRRHMARQMTIGFNSKLPFMIFQSSESKIMRKLGTFLLSDIRIKIGVLILFAGYIIGAAIGIVGLEAHQDFSQIIPDDSYLHAFYDDVDTFFNELGHQYMFGLDTNLNYSDYAVYTEIEQFTQSVEADSCFMMSDYTSSWVRDYYIYLQTNYAAWVDTDGSFKNSSLFYNILFGEYLLGEGLNYRQDIWETVLQDYGMASTQNYSVVRTDTIERSRIWMSGIAMGTGTDRMTPCLASFKRLTAAYEKSLGAYYYTRLALFAEADLITIEQTVYNLIYACSAAFVITIIMVPYPLMSLFVMVAVGQILFGVLGYMSMWGMDIDTGTMINIITCVGFSVDNAAHFCHSYMTAPVFDIPGTSAMSDHDERHARVLFALNAVGMPILAGDISTILALMPLVMSQSYLFRAFFKVLFMVMIFGVGHAVLYLPVVLSLFGPVLGDGTDNEEENPSSSGVTAPTRNKLKQKISKKHQKDIEMMTADHAVAL